MKGAVEKHGTQLFRIKEKLIEECSATWGKYVEKSIRAAGGRDEVVVIVEAFEETVEEEVESF